MHDPQIVMARTLMHQIVTQPQTYDESDNVLVSLNPDEGALITLALVIVGRLYPEYDRVTTPFTEKLADLVEHHIGLDEPDDV